MAARNTEAVVLLAELRMMAVRLCPALVPKPHGHRPWPRVGAEASDSSSNPGQSLRTAPRCTSIDIEPAAEQQAQSENFCSMPLIPAAVHLLGLLIFFFCQTMVAFDCSSFQLHLASSATIFSIACRAIMITPWAEHSIIGEVVIIFKCTHTARWPMPRCFKALDVPRRLIR